MKTIYFITHPNVVIDPDVPITQWPLSEAGLARMEKLLAQPWVDDLQAIYSSDEQKAIDGAAILANHVGVDFVCRTELGEMDRSATGYLQRSEFEQVVDEFFMSPHSSIRGWETAVSAQQRIIHAIDTILQTEPAQHIAIVAHGAVGALYLSHLKQRPISRREDQPDTHGGNYFAFQTEPTVLLHDWQPIDP